MPADVAPDRVLDRLPSTGEVTPDLRAPHPQLQAVPVSVEGHRMPAGGDPLRKLRMARDLLADQEEHRPRVRRGEDLEHGRGPLRMRAVIERQHHARWRPRELARDPDRARGSRRDRRERCQNGVHAGIIPEVTNDYPNLDGWLPDPAVRIKHRRESTASPELLWRA